MDGAVQALNSISAREPVRLILDRLEGHGYRACVVGGAVRDCCLGIIPLDVDILTDAPCDRVTALFQDQKTRLVGVSFAVNLVNGVEVASCRSVHDFPSGDLGSRDLTVNSMAWDPFDQILIDPFDGRKDIEQGIIRFTGDAGERIKEDPLRMVRACRFAARYNAFISPDALAAIHARGDWLASRTAPERLRLEVIKAMAMDRPSRFFNLLFDTGQLSFIFESLSRCHDLDGGPFHGETVFEHCMLVGDALPAGRPLLRLAGFLHDTGKFDAACIKDGKLSFAGHETCLAAVEKDLACLRFSNQEMRYILALIQAHMRPLAADSTPRAVRRLMAMLEDLDLDYKDFLRMRIADKKGNLAKQPYTLKDIRIRLEKIHDAMAGQSAFCINDLKISGRDIQDILSIGPGPRIGQVKARLFERVLASPELNTPSALVRLVAEMRC